MVEAEIRSLAVDASRQFRQSSAATRTATVEREFATIVVDEIEPDPNRNIFVEDAEAEPWDICFRHVRRRVPVGTPIYRVLEHELVDESSRIFVKFPPAERDTYDAIYRKLQREAAQLSGIAGPRIVILETKALGDISEYDETLLKEQISRVTKNIPELACVWLSVREWQSGVRRHKYRSLFVPNPDSVYQVPMSFLNRYGHREWKVDYVTGREYGEYQ